MTKRSSHRPPLHPLVALADSLGADVPLALEAAVHESGLALLVVETLVFKKEKRQGNLWLWSRLVSRS